MAPAKGWKPDIWSARSIAFDGMKGLKPVTVAIWDSGFDRTLFPGQLLTGPDGKPVRGPAFDEKGDAVTYDLLPLTSEQARLYPSMISDEQGVSDLQNGIESPAADALRAKIAAMTPAQMQAFSSWTT